MRGKGRKCEGLRDTYQGAMEKARPAFSAHLEPASVNILLWARVSLLQWSRPEMPPCRCLYEPQAFSPFSSPLKAPPERRTALGAGLAFAMEPSRDAPMQVSLRATAFSPFSSPQKAPPERVPARRPPEEKVNWLQEYSKLY